MNDAVCCGVVARGIHGIAAGLVEGRLASIVRYDTSSGFLSHSLTGNLTSLVVVCVIVTIVVEMIIMEL